MGQSAAFAKVEVTKTSEHWYPKADYMLVEQKAEPFNMYDSKAYGADDGTQRKAGLTGQQPRMPETAPARRSVTSSADHQRGSSTARHTPQLPAALTQAQPLQMASSLCHGYWILISGTPVMWTRACDYYVFALRKLLI